MDGNTIEFLVSDGTTHDIKIAPDGYDSDTLHHQIKNKGVRANIPKKKNTKSNNDRTDWYLYKTTHVIENAFAKLKYFCGIVTRFDKLKQSSEATVALACAYIWVKL